MYYCLFIFIIEHLISSILLLMTIVFQLSSQISMLYFSFIFYDNFCSKHQALCYLSLNIHISALFILYISSTITLGYKYSYFLINYVIYIKCYPTWLQKSSFIIIYVTYIKYFVLFCSYIELIL